MHLAGHEKESAPLWPRKESERASEKGKELYREGERNHYVTLRNITRCLQIARCTSSEASRTRIHSHTHIYIRIRIRPRGNGGERERGRGSSSTAAALDPRPSSARLPFVIPPSLLLFLSLFLLLLFHPPSLSLLLVGLSN